MIQGMGRSLFGPDTGLSPQSLSVEPRPLTAQIRCRQRLRVCAFQNFGSWPLLSFFHLLSHAYFKAILFMCAGMVIHNIKDYQDIRKIRIISRIIPLTFRVMTVANLSLCGLPFLSGFYSKDMILEVMIISNINLVIFILIIVATFFTVAYSCRMSFLLGLINTRKESIYVSDDRDKLMITGILFLFPFSIIGGINII